MKIKLFTSILLLYLLSFTNLTYGQNLNLGNLQNFLVYTAGGAVSNTNAAGNSNFVGDIGSFTGAITGFGTPYNGGDIISGDFGNTYYNEALARQAKEDLLNIYIHLCDVPVTNFVHAPAFGSETLLPGVYLIQGAGSVAGNLILDGGGDPNAMFIIRFNGALSAGAGCKIILTGGATAKNIFWIAEGVVSIEADSVIKGTLIAHPGSITIANNADVEGRLLSTEGAISYIGGKSSMPEGVATVPISCTEFCGNPIMGTAADFILFSGDGSVSSGGTSSLIGDIGTNGGAVTNLAGATVIGNVYSEPNLITAKALEDLNNACSQLTAITEPAKSHAVVFGNGETLEPGVYSIAGAGSLAGNLTLDGKGDPDALFIFKFAGAFSTGSQSRVILVNGVRSCNIFWVATGGAVSLGTFTHMKGNLIANPGANSAGANSNLEGGMYSTAGAVSFSTGVNYKYSHCNKSIIANPDTGISVIGACGGISFVNVLNNDRLNGRVIQPSQVTITLISATKDNAVFDLTNNNIYLDGSNVVVAPGTPAGNYILTYKICEVANPADCAQTTVTVPVADNQAPVISCPGNANRNVNTAVCTYTSVGTEFNATATDNCAVTSLTYALSGATSGSGTNLGGIVFNKGVTTVTWSATDGVNTAITCSFTVTVADNQAPVISCPGNANRNVNTAACNYTAVGTEFNATATDNCAVTSLTYVLSGANSGSGTNLAGIVFNKGVTTVTWSATDAANNTITCTQNVTVTDDEAPSITCPGNISVNNTPGTCGAAVSYTTPVGTDNCSVATTTQTAGLASGATFPIGTTTITYTATDAALNTFSSSFTVTINDTENPTIVGLPANITSANTIGVCGKVITWAAPTSADNCAGTSIAQTAGPVSGSTFPIGITTITYTATDAALNTFSSSFTVTITDNEIPIITSNGNKIVNNDTNKCGATVIVSATATDNCSVDSPLGIRSDNLALNADFPVGTTTITWNVTDYNGNIATTITQTVRVIDNTPPTITSLPALLANCSVTISVAPISPDNCGTITGVTGDITLPYTFSTPGFYIVGWNFTDASGNSKNISQSITVIDDAAPVPNVTNLPTLNLTRCELLSSQLTYPTAFDTCNGTIVGVPSIQFPYTILGTSVINWTYRDSTGNVSTQNQTINMTSEVINGGILKGYLTVNNSNTAATSVNITSCKSGGNEIKINLTGQTGTIIQWEKFEVGNATWVTIPNTTNNYTVTFYPATTQSTFFRALIKVNSCLQYSSSFYVRALPADQPPVLTQSLYNICLNESITLVARRGYTIQEDAIAGKGGDFNQGQLNTQDPNSWLVDGNPGGFTAGGNNTSPRNWSATNNHQFGNITYDSENYKFAITSGNHNITSGPNKYTGANPAILESPIFSLAKSSAASLDFDQAYYFATGDMAIIYISLDGGVTYSILKTMHAVNSPQLSWFTDPNVTSAQKVGATATQYNFKNDNTSISLNAYLGQTNVRIKWAFRGTDDKSVWAMDNISIPITAIIDAIEWTDGIGNPNQAPIANGILETSFNLTPQAPGKHQYGATVLVDGCRSYDASGTALADVNVSYSYAGNSINLGPEVCGSNTVKLNAYDNFKTANQNAAKDSYTVPSGCTTCNDQGTGIVGTWSITGSSSCGIGTFSNINDPDTIFTGEVGNYVLSWTVKGCASFVNVSISNCSTVDFDGTNDYIDFKKQNYDLNSNFSVEVWVKTVASSSTIQTIFSKRNGNVLGNGYDLRIQNDFVTFRWNDSGSITSPYKIGSNRWYHIAVTFANNEYKLYIDGILMISKPGSSLPVVNNYKALLGAMDQDTSAPFNPINYFKGWIDEFKIWNVALNEEQIHQMMNQEIKEQTIGNNVVYGEIIPLPIYGLTWSNLKGYYRMDQTGCGYLKPNFGVGFDGKLKNINSAEPQTAPLPYYSISNGDWTNTSASTPWALGNTVWDFPNSRGINGALIDWNIVRSSHNINSTAKDINLLGLISVSGKITIANPTQALDEKNDGQGLFISHYLKLNGDLNLVGESQLIQKRYTLDQISESVFETTSLGYIKRDQQGKKNSYNYNYWSSPVNLIQGVTNNAPYIIKSILRDGTISANPKIINFGVSTDFADSAITDPLKITDRWIWTYNSPIVQGNDLENYKQWYQITSNGSIKVGEGYTMKGTGGVAPITATQNYTFIGKPNSGTITLNFSKDSSYLVGNPYPSAIDADEFIKDNLKDCLDCKASENSFSGALYFWDHFGLSNNHTLSEYEGGYATYTLMGGVAAINNSPLNKNDGASGVSTPKRFITVAQGFFIDGFIENDISGPQIPTVVHGGPILFKNSQRVFQRETTSNSVSMKKRELSKSNADLRPKIRLGFDTPIGGHRQILVGADKNTSNQFDIGYDALLYDLNENDMYWEINKSNFVIQAVPDFNTDQIIPFAIATSKEGDVKIKIDELENIPSNTTIYLYDNQTNLYHDLRNSEFKTALAKGEYKNRFSLKFEKTQTLSLDPVKTIRDDEIIVFYSKKILYINNHTLETKINSVSLYNINGQSIINWKIDTQNQQDIQILNKNLSSGVYIAKLSTTEGEITKKIIF
jgi:hypothetical protein